MSRVLGKLMLFSSLLLVSCGQEKAKVNMHVEGLKDAYVAVRALKLNKEVLIDSVKSDAAGNLRFNVNLGKEGNPEFVSVYHNGRRMAYMLLEKGDKAVVETDTLGFYGGNYSVKGSPESARLYEYEKDFAEILDEYNVLSSHMETAMAASDDARVNELKYDLGKFYVDVKRASVRKVMENINSFSSITLLYRYLNPSLPVFGDNTDGVIFKRLYDSLSVKYPASPFVRSLKEEADSRMNLLMMSDRVDKAEVIDFPDLVLPDMNSKEVALSSLKGKTVLLFFWTSIDASQNMFNQELKSLYASYRDKGLEIYQVSLDVDKTQWASTVRSQGLDWINVCDGKGLSSPAALSYNIEKLPSVFIIDRNGSILDGVTIDNFRSRLKSVIAG